MIYLEMYRVSTPGHCPNGSLSLEVARRNLINDRSSAPLPPFYSFAFLILFFFLNMSFAVTYHSERVEIRTEELGFACVVSKRIKEEFGPRLQACKLLFKPRIQRFSFEKVLQTELDLHTTTPPFFCYFWLFSWAFHRATDSLCHIFHCRPTPNFYFKYPRHEKAATPESIFKVLSLIFCNDPVDQITWKRELVR